MCEPFIGVVIGNGELVEIGYYAVTTDNFPSLQSVLDVLVTLLGYFDIPAHSEHHSSWKQTCGSPLSDAPNIGDVLFASGSTPEVGAP